MDQETKNQVWVSIIAIVVVLVIIVGLVVGYQKFKVYSAEQSGKAELAQAEWNRQIIVRQAQAKKDAVSLEVEAEILRVGGVSKVNEIVAQGLGGPEGYLRYLSIHMLEENHDK